MTIKPNLCRRLCVWTDVETIIRPVTLSGLAKRGVGCSTFFKMQYAMINLGLALSLGSVIGLERQLKQRHSGLVTHELVALGAAAYSSLPNALGIEADPRMAAQVLTGIGSLRAGANALPVQPQAMDCVTGSVHHRSNLSIAQAYKLEPELFREIRSSPGKVNDQPVDALAA